MAHDSGKDADTHIKDAEDAGAEEEEEEEKEEKEDRVKAASASAAEMPRFIATLLGVLSLTSCTRLVQTTSCDGKLGHAGTCKCEKGNRSTSVACAAAVLLASGTDDADTVASASTCNVGASSFADSTFTGLLNREV